MFEDMTKKVLDANTHVIQLYQELGRVVSRKENNEIVYYHPEFGELLRVSENVLVIG